LRAIRVCLRVGETGGEREKRRGRFLLRVSCIKFILYYTSNTACEWHRKRNGAERARCIACANTQNRLDQHTVKAREVCGIGSENVTRDGRMSGPTQELPPTISPPRDAEESAAHSSASSTHSGQYCSEASSQEHLAAPPGKLTQPDGPHRKWHAGSCGEVRSATSGRFAGDLQAFDQHSNVPLVDHA
jgi:hypothetical protein